MKNVLCVFIWDKTENVYTRSVVVDNKTKELKFKGKKPNKVIIPKSCTNKGLLRKVKNICSYNSVIIKAKGK